MLQRARPKWRTPKYRAEDYVRKLHSALSAAGGRICSSTDVSKLELSEGQGIRVVASNGQYVSASSPVFDKVVPWTSLEPILFLFSTTSVGHP